MNHSPKDVSKPEPFTVCELVDLAAGAFGITPEAARAALEKAKEEENKIKVGDVVSMKNGIVFQVRDIYSDGSIRDGELHDWNLHALTKVTHPEVIAYVKGLRK